MMSETHTHITHRKLKTPRAAAIAGILFALLFGTGLVLIRISIPTDPAAENTWLVTNSRTVSLALNLIPYAGIAFLWFIGVILGAVCGVVLALLLAPEAGEELRQKIQSGAAVNWQKANIELDKLKQSASKANLPEGRTNP